MASMAHTPADKDLVEIDAGHLSGCGMTQIAFKTHSTFLRNYMYDFIESSLHT